MATAKSQPRQTRQTRAEEILLTGGIRVLFEDTDHTSYLVPAQSRRVPYEVWVDPYGIPVYCECPDWERQQGLWPPGVCKHALAASLYHKNRFNPTIGETVALLAEVRSVLRDPHAEAVELAATCW